MRIPVSIIAKPLTGAPVTVTRPNNVVAYAVGQVFGAAGDARVSFTTPAQPSDADRAFMQPALSFECVDQVGAAAGSLNLQLILFAAQPATVLADQAALALSDADIALVIPWGSSNNISGQVPFATGAGSPNTVNTTNRRLAVATGGVMTILTWATTYWLYLWSGSAYTPAANEVLTITPSFTYAARVPS